MRNQRGNLTIVMAALIAVAALLALGIVRIGATAAARARTQAAADAAALAGVRDGRAAADAIARRNGAELVGFDDDGFDVVVTVRRGAHTAVARARWDPIDDLSAAPSRGDVTASRTLRVRGHETPRQARAQCEEDGGGPRVRPARAAA